MEIMVKWGSVGLRACCRLKICLNITFAHLTGYWLESTTVWVSPLPKAALNYFLWPKFYKFLSVQVQFMYGLTFPSFFFPHLESKFFSAISINKEQKQSSGSSLCGAKECNEEKMFWEMLTDAAGENSPTVTNTPSLAAKCKFLWEAAVSENSTKHSTGHDPWLGPPQLSWQQSLWGREKSKSSLGKQEESDWIHILSPCVLTISTFGG